MAEKNRALAEALTRRVALGLLAVGVTGCRTWPDMPDFPTTPDYDRIIDGHTHLFNAADLPVVGFVNCVLVPEFAPGVNGGVLALVDAIVATLKILPMSAEWELRQRRGMSRPKLTVTTEEFGQAIAARSLEVQGGSTKTEKWLGADNADLAVSYDVLFLAMSGYAPTNLEKMALFGTPERDATPSIALASRRAVIEAQLNDADITEASYASIEKAGPLIEAFRPKLLAATAIDFGQVLKWVWVLLQSRTSHLERYLKVYTGEHSQPRTLMNFLVDYDAWLDDGPGRGSSHQSQIKLWAAVRDEYRADVDLRTFAGYCPLKHALELKRDGRANTFEALKAAWRNREISGLKLYPPMGFKTYGNRTDGNEKFIGTNGIKRIAVDAWEKVAGRGAALGPALDDALHETYQWCAQEGIPVVAHAGPGNQAAAGFGAKASPTYWSEALKAHGNLRIGLAHLIEDAVSFTKAMEANQPDASWALGPTMPFLRHAIGVRKQVYFDIGFTEELVDPKHLAQGFPKRFFTQLKRYCEGDSKFEAVDPGCMQIMYGTDWLMLGQIKNHERYLNIVHDGLEAAGWTVEAKRNFFELNAKALLAGGMR